MELLEQFSETNIVNTVSLYLAAKLLERGYGLYWHARDAVQTPDGWYFDWGQQYAAYLGDPVFGPWLAGAKGLVMLTDDLPAEPRFVQRPIEQVGPVPQHQVMVPVLSVEVGPAVAMRNFELGSKLKWRGRHLVVEGYVRTKAELGVFKDALGNWFDNETCFDIADHDAGTLATVGQIEFCDTLVDYDINVNGTEAATYQVICNSRLEYVA
jgi:hypothetical protein